MINYSRMIKRAVLTSLLWCISLTIIGLLLLLLGLREPGGYIRWVNPFMIFIFTYWFYLAAAFIHMYLLNKMKWNKWLTALIGVVIIYILIIIPLILDDDYFKTLDWKVPLFLIVQTVCLVLLDGVTKRWFVKS